MTTALLIIDMQNFFAPMTSAPLPQILHLASYFKARSLPLILTQHGQPASELTPPFTNQLVRKLGPSGSIAMGSKDWELMPEIAALVNPSSSSSSASATAPPSSPSPASSDDPPIIHKTTYDAFINTDLSLVLAERKIERVVVCGVMTDCCCDTSARSAFNRGYETWLVHDACGTANRRQHETGLNGFGYAFGEVLGTEEVVRRLE
ncbi:MAG: hypothetical protein Q9169_005673 [Polycauliona sp. 2 TL-2023]